jgi:hypothetical protein
MWLMVARLLGAGSIPAVLGAHPVIEKLIL